MTFSQGQDDLAKWGLTCFLCCIKTNLFSVLTLIFWGVFLLLLLLGFFAFVVQQIKILNSKGTKEKYKQFNY